MPSRILAAAALLLAIAVPAAAAGRTTGTDGAALLARYEPVLQLYAVDRTPSAIEPFLAGADLERLTAGRWRLVRPNPPASALANGPTQLRLDTRACSPSTNLDACYRRTATPPTVYGRAWASPTASAGTATILQYWLFYPLDDWRNSLSRPTVWHMHEGDWEEVAVALDAADRPLEVAASQHDLGIVRTWARVRKSGTHPVVYVALGSHANYLVPGLRGVAGVPHVIPPRFSGVILPEPDFTPATQTAVRSAAIVDLTSGVAPWLTFAGAWGDGNYILLRRVASGRARYTHLRVGESPPGPAFHSIWRDPLLQFRSWPADDGH